MPTYRPGDVAISVFQMGDGSGGVFGIASGGVARDLLIRDSSRRLAAVLLRVTALGEVPPGDEHGYALTQAELGEMANISRHHVNRTLGMMRRAGWVDAR